MSDKLPYRSFTTAFKEAACQRISRGDKVMPLSRELGVPRKLLYNWFNSWKLEGVAGLNRKRGRSLGTKLERKSPGTKSILQPAASELASARARIVELERLVGRQQVDLDFFRKALRALSDQDTQGKIVSASLQSSEP
jgi:transposase